MLVGLSVLLSLMVPALQITFRLPDSLATNVLLGITASLPMNLYLVPRLLACLDAEVKGDPANAAATWKEGFEGRWLLAGAAKVLLGVFVLLGLSAFVLPGLIFLFAFGWVPFRILLRGEGPLEAVRSSLALSFQNRVGMLAVGGFLGLAYFTVLLLVAFVVILNAPNPTPMDRLTRPLFVVSYAAGALLELGMSMALLGFFHHLEARTTFTSRNTPEAP